MFQICFIVLKYVLKICILFRPQEVAIRTASGRQTSPLSPHRLGGHQRGTHRQQSSSTFPGAVPRGFHTQPGGGDGEAGRPPQVSLGAGAGGGARNGGVPVCGGEVRQQLQRLESQDMDYKASGKL